MRVRVTRRVRGRVRAKVRNTDWVAMRSIIIIIMIFTYKVRNNCDKFFVTMMMVIEFRL